MPNRAIWDSVPSSFTDPVTGLRPSRERELTALLCFFHQKGLVPWQRVSLLPPDTTATGIAADAIFAFSGTMICEYPLFAAGEDINVWGAMPADLIYLSSDQRTVALVENKIGGRFTSGGDHVEHGQLARQAEYLCRSKTRRGLRQACLVLVTTVDCLRTKNYASVLANVLAHRGRNQHIDGYVMRWEDIFEAVSSMGMVKPAHAVTPHALA